MTSKAELFDELETLGFDCGRNSRYTVGMLTQIRDNLRENAALLVDQAIQLTARDYRIRILKLIEHKYTVSEDLIREKSKTISNLEKRWLEISKELKELKETHSETEECHDNAHKKLNESIAKHAAYEGYIEQLNDEMKDLRREAKNNRKKNRKLEKKSNKPAEVVYISAPEYDPPEYNLA